MTLPKLYNLGEIIGSAALFSDCHLTKQALADSLGTSRPSVQRYDGLVFWLVPDYPLDYPQLPKDQWLLKKSKFDRTAPLSPYQVYVISLIQGAFKHLRKEASVRTFVQQNPYLFSKYSYQARLARLAKDAQTA